MGDTIIDLKQIFLNNQIRILSTPLAPSQGWHDNAPIPEQGVLKDKTVQDAIRKVNNILRQHNRAAYSTQASRHVAEQIDSLYWISAEPESYTGELDEGEISRDADLRDDETIALLPAEWPADDTTSDASSLEQFAESTRYRALHVRLVTLAARRAEQQARLAQLRHLHGLLEPFQDAQKNVQPNLVTRDGELARELERMKMLMARVGGKLEGLESGRPVRDEEGEGMEWDAQESVRMALRSGE